MIKKILHVSDIHFRNFNRQDEFRTVAENLIFQAKEKGVDRIVITGDIVHSRNQMTPELVDIVSWFLKECAAVTGKVIIIAGNHDIVEQNKERMDALTPIVEALGLDDVVYIKHSSVQVDDNVAWVTYSIYDNHIPPEPKDMVKAQGKLKIGLYHGAINGAVNDMGFQFHHGSSTDKFEGCDIVLCGDIHKRQVLTNKSGIPLIYAGSLIQQDFTETVSNHGYNIITVNEDNTFTYELYEIENPVKYLNFKISDIMDIEESKEVLTNA
jgi:DNA repair exonuclease SbcCD nuclease subunit